MTLSLLLAAALVASEPLQTASPPAEGQAPIVTKTYAEPGAAGLDVIWASTWDEAVEKARKIRNGRILLYFADEDCPQCTRMESLIIPSTSFYAFTRDKVPLRLFRHTPDGQRLSERLRIPEVPAWVVVTPDLVVSGAQFGSTSQFAWIDTFIKAEAGWAEYMKALAAEAENPADPARVFQAAKATYQRGGDGLAEPRFRRLAANRKAPAEIRDQSLAYLASIELDSRRIDDAAGHLDQLLRTTKDPTIRQRAELRRADVDVARGHPDLAIQRLQAFKKAHPLSPFVKDADALIDFLRAKKETPR